jgi:hypothetical protein
MAKECYMIVMTSRAEEPLFVAPQDGIYLCQFAGTFASSYWYAPMRNMRWCKGGKSLSEWYASDGSQLNHSIFIEMNKGERLVIKLSHYPISWTLGVQSF